MRFFLSLLLVLLIGVAAPAGAQNLEPLDLARKIFGPAPFPQMEHHLAGEYRGRPSGLDLPAGTITRFLLLEQKADKAVVAMSLLDSTGEGLDTYLHFTKDSVWKMRAFRSLAMTGIIEQAKAELERMTPEEVDAAIARSKEAGRKRTPFTSRADYEYTLGNVRLILSLDETIIRHFLDHKAEFDRIKRAAYQALEEKGEAARHSAGLLKSLEADCRNLFVSSISFDEGEVAGKSLKFIIGGILDNTVGFLYVRDEKDLPEMSAGGIIMLRKIGDGWYLYKTT